MQWTQISERVVNDVAILDLRGDLTLSERPGQLFRKIRGLLDQGRTKVLLNLVDVPYIDSEALGEIVHGYTTATRSGRRLKLCGLTQRIRDLLVASQLDKYFETFESEQDALQSFAARV